jgi:hypothetical protein
MDGKKKVEGEIKMTQGLIKPYELPGEFDPKLADFKLCQWHELIRHIPKYYLTAWRIDVSPCSEEATCQVWTIVEDYWVCSEHKQLWEGLKDD